LIWPEKISASPSLVAESGYSTHKNLNIRSREREPLKRFSINVTLIFDHCPALDPDIDVSRKAIRYRRFR